MQGLRVQVIKLRALVFGFLGLGRRVPGSGIQSSGFLVDLFVLRAAVPRKPRQHEGQWGLVVCQLVGVVLVDQRHARAAVQRHHAAQ